MENRDLEHYGWKKVVGKLQAAGCVYAEEEARLLLSSSRDCGELALMLERRMAGYPLEHIIGWAEFCGLRIEVDPGVFVPRQRTEFLLQQALAFARSGDVVVDLCCGTGAMGAALIARTDRIELHAVDIDPAAVRCARRNIVPEKGNVYEGDLFDPLPPRLRSRVQVLMANAPYVPTGALSLMPAEARLHEAMAALDGGADGLDIQRRIAAEAPLWLAERGVLLVETSERQAPLTAELFARHGLLPEWVRCEEKDANVMIGVWKERRNR